MIDVKKLITGFLILAAASISSGVILSFVSMHASNTPVSAPAAMIADNATSTLANAFLPDENVNYDQYLSTSTMQSTSSDPNNLTDVLATAFVNGVAAANPDGPVSDNGDTVLAHPNEADIENQLAASPALGKVPTPNWDVEAGSQPIKSTAANADSVASYSQQLAQVVNTNLIASNVEGIVSNQNADPSQVGFVSTQIKQTLDQTLALPTPTSLVPFQKSLVTVLVYEKNELQLAANVNDDPVKTSLILQNEQAGYDNAVANMNTQIKKASAIQGFSFGGPGPGPAQDKALAFFDSALGIQTAHAQWLTFDAANFSQWIEKFVENIILQILKNTLTALIQRKVLTWVQGSGAPRWVTSWGTTLINSYQQTAINAINSQMTCGTFPAYIPQIKITLGSYYKPGGNNACANQFQAALGSNSFQQFYNNFANGGFIAFAAASLPSGNPYGGLFFNAQVVSYNAQNAQSATLAKTTSAQGQKGDQACGDGSDPNNGEHTVCENPDGPDYTITGTEKCGPGDTPVVYANAGICDDGSEPTVTTPGVFTGFAVNSAFDASPKLVTAANDIVGLLNALLGSLLNSLASLAVNAVGSAVNSGLSGGVAGIPPTTITGGGTSTITTVALSCNPPTQTVSSTFPVTIGAVGGKTDPNGNPPTYTWLSSDGQAGAGYIFSPVYNLPGTYTETINDSTGDAPATCRVIAN